MESNNFNVEKRPERKIVRYKECHKNHAAALGGNASDGCGEFMPAGEEGTLEALKCSACNCHRNFHRKEIHHSDSDYPSHQQYNILSMIPDKPLLAQSSPNKSGSISPSGQSYEKDYHEDRVREIENPKVIRKRFRTKFTQEQKEKMLGLAVKAGWKIQKLEKSEVQKFCQEIGIKRRVLKVWMHNNKNTFAKRDFSTS